MIKSSKHSLKFTNKVKQDLLNRIFIDYKACLEAYIQMIIDGRLPLLKRLSSKDLPIISNIEKSHWREECYKQASSMIRGELTRKKRLQLQDIKININEVSINLGYKNFDIQQINSFDEFIRIATPYKLEQKIGRFQYQTVNIPIKYHRQSNKLLSQGYTRQKKFIQLSRNNVKLVYEKSDITKRETGSIIAYDCGYKKLLSDNLNNHYGKHLEGIYKKLANKKRGSKNYKQLLQHKKNEINRVCNALNLEDIQTVIIENLKNVKKNSRLARSVNNRMQYWSYRQVRSKLEDRSKAEGFYLITVNPAYTSQTCSSCGKVDSSQRNGEIYQCSCGLLMDADTNAAINILHRGVYSPSNNIE